eukprot:3271141-Prymnesium_polylepis.1
MVHGLRPAHSFSALEPQHHIAHTRRAAVCGGWRYKKHGAAAVARDLLRRRTAASAVRKYAVAGRRAPRGVGGSPAGPTPPVRCRPRPCPPAQPVAQRLRK